jgi:hypothetical protein
MVRFTILLTALAVNHAAPAEAPTRCAEDQPCFSWSTMGDHRRGVTIDGHTRVVGPCAFQRLVYERGITVRPLHGDGYALRYGCGFDVQDY